MSKFSNYYDEENENVIREWNIAFLQSNLEYFKSWN